MELLFRGRLPIYSIVKEHVTLPQLRDTMKDILEHLDTGIYFLSDAGLAIDWQQLEAVPDWMIFHVDGCSITNSEIYLQTVAQALKSPEYCMYNFDAMLDCLRSIPVYRVGANRYVIFYTDFNTFYSHDKQQFDVALEVFQDAVSSWQERRPSLRLNVILIGSPIDLPKFAQIL